MNAGYRFCPQCATSLEWIVYAAMVPPLVLTALIGLAQAVRGFETGVTE